MQVNRRSLYRCRHDRRLAGVASGIAEYFDLDVSLVRVLWVLSIFVGGMGIFLYIAMAIIVPLEPEYLPQPGAEAPGGATAFGEGMTGTEGDPSGAGAASGTSASPTGWHAGAVPHRRSGGGSGMGVTFFGMLLILFGALALIDAYLPGWADGGRFLWPAFILSVGALLVATAVRRRPNEQ
jgi:phage shock protein C